MQTKHFFIVFERTDLTVKVSSLAKNLANLVSINIGTHGTGILKTWKTTLTLLMSSFSDCSLPTISSAGPPKSAYMLHMNILFLRFCFAIGRPRFLLCLFKCLYLMQCTGLFVLFKAADTCICFCFDAPSPGICVLF